MLNISTFLCSSHDDDKLTARSSLSKVVNGLGQRPSYHLFMNLRQFPADGHWTFSTKDLSKLLQAFQQAMGRFIEDHGAALLCQL